MPIEAQRRTPKPRKTKRGVSKSRVAKLKIVPAIQARPFVSPENMHFKGIPVDQIIETHEDLIAHSYPLLIQNKGIAEPVMTAKSKPKSKKGKDLDTDLDPSDDSDGLKSDDSDGSPSE